MARAARERNVLKLRSPPINAGESRDSTGDLERANQDAGEGVVTLNGLGELETVVAFPSTSKMGGGRKFALVEDFMEAAKPGGRLASRTEGESRVQWSDEKHKSSKYLLVQ